MDAVIPIEIGMPTTRTAVQGQRNEDQELERHLDWANKVRGSATIRMASYQQRATAYYNRRARPHAFKVGTLVLRKVFETESKGEPKSSKQIGKDLMLSKKPVSRGPTTCKSWTERPYSDHGMYLT